MKFCENCYYCFTGKFLEEEMFDEFDNEPVPEKPVETKKSKTQTLDEWIEDEDGNFIRKGE